MPATERQIKYCHDIAKRIGSTPCDDDGVPLFEKSAEAANAYIKENRLTQWTDKQQREFDDRNVPSDWGVANY